MRPSGRILLGTLTRSAGASVSRATVSDLSVGVVLLLHGLASHKDHNFAPALARALSVRANLNVIRFNFRSASPSPHEPQHRFRISGADDEVDDVRAVLAALAARAMHAVALVGHSRGAAVALYSAAQLPALFGLDVALLAPRWKPADMLEGPFFSAETIGALESGAFTQYVWATKAGDILVTRDDVVALRAAGTMAAPLAALADRVRVLVIHGDADRIIPLSSAQAFAQARPLAVRLVIVPGGGHNFNAAVHADSLIDAVVDFLK